MSSRGVDAAPLHAGGAKVVPRRAASAADVRAGYHRRLDELVTRMADAFRVRFLRFSQCVALSVEMSAVY